jgi:hypothetical protein
MEKPNVTKQISTVFSAADFMRWAQTSEGRTEIRKWRENPVTQQVITAFIDSTRHRPMNLIKNCGMTADSEAINAAFSDGQQDILFALLQIERLTEKPEKATSSVAEQQIRDHLINVEGYKNPETVTRGKR